MRFTALLVECLLLFPPAILLMKTKNNIIANVSLLIFLMKPDVILIDHGHFQYNSLILGLILWAFYCLLNKRFYWCCFLFTIALFAKQMATYYALAFFAGLIGMTYQEHRFNKKYILVEFLKYIGITSITVLLIWAPFCSSWENISLVLKAIFPVHRGLYQLKVPNFWCISDMVMKWQTHYSKPTLLFICSAVSLVCSIPAMIALVVNPSRKILIIAFQTVSLTFFMFAYHVHEKSILLPMLMCPLIA